MDRLRVDAGPLVFFPLPRWVKIVAVEAKDLYRLGEGLSEDMTRRLPEVIDATKGVLNAWI
jgi:hypothetical protein